MSSLQKFGFLSLIFIIFGSQAFAQTPTEKPQIAKNTEEKTSTTSAEETTETPVSNNNFQYNRVGVQNDRTMPISLNEAIKKALENNNEIEISRTDVRIQETNLRSLLGIYDPVISVSPNFSRNNTTGSTATKDFRVNSDFSGLIRRGGGNYSVFFNNNRTENNFAQSQLSAGNASSSGSALYSSSLGVNYTQPLFRNLSIDNNRRQIKIQRKRLQQSDADFRRQTINTISQVQRAYWDLVFALRDQQNKVDNLNLSKENLRQVEAKISAGTLAPLARAEVNTEVANRETEVLNAAQQVSISENTLKQLILRDPNSDEWNVSYVPTDKPVYSDEPVNLDLAMKDAMENRLELRRLKLAREINQIDINYFRNQTKPQIDLNTSFSLGGLASNNGSAEFTTFQFVGNDEILRQRLNLLLPANQQIANTPIFVPATPSYLVGGFGRTFANLFRSDAPNFSVGVTFSFPLRNTRAKADLAGAQIQQEQISAQTRQQENTVFTEVRNAVQALETSRLRVLSARKARQNAEIQLEGERKLFDAGRSNTFLLFQRENSLANARNAEIRAETDYNKAISDLQRVTSTTFQMNNIQIDSPVEIEDK
ncbi:MAG TPA: TolC family protein [Pyrinomonadaceae bacterium]|nr:TolC family protein [Pyrinomonadaceae bacterium]